LWGWTRGGAGEGFRPGRCNLLFGGFSVGTDGEGAAGIAGAGAGGAGLVGIVVVAVGQRRRKAKKIAFD